MLQDIHEVHADDGVTTDPHHRSDSHALVDQVGGVLVAHGPTAGYDRDSASLSIKKSRHDAHLALSGGDNADGVGTDKSDALFAGHFFYAHDIVHRNVLRDDHQKRYASFNSFGGSGKGEGGGHYYHGDIN